MCVFLFFFKEWFRVANLIIIIKGKKKHKKKKMGMKEDGKN